MLVLLDEMLPRPLARRFPGHDVRTVQQMGWDGRRNGDLLRLAASAGFQALVTADRNLEFQQNVARSGLGVVVLSARSTTPETILQFASQVVTALASLQPGQVIRVGTPTRV